MPYVTGILASSKISYTCILSAKLISTNWTRNMRGQYLWDYLQDLKRILLPSYAIQKPPPCYKKLSLPRHM